MEREVRIQIRTYVPVKDIKTRARNMIGYRYEYIRRKCDPTRGLGIPTRSCENSLITKSNTRKDYRLLLLKR